MAQETETFVYATYIRTTPEKLWAALTQGDFSEKYWFGFRFEAELKAGADLCVRAQKGKEQYGNVVGKILVCEPLKKLVYTFSNDKHELASRPNGPSRVTYELTPMGPLVKLRLIHENLAPEDVVKDPNKFQGVNNGWPAIISSLKSLLETGKAIAFEV